MDVVGYVYPLAGGVSQKSKKADVRGVKNKLRRGGALLRPRLVHFCVSVKFKGEFRI